MIKNTDGYTIVSKHWDEYDHDAYGKTLRVAMQKFGTSNYRNHDGSINTKVRWFHMPVPVEPHTSAWAVAFYFRDEHDATLFALCT